MTRVLSFVLLTLSSPVCAHADTGYTCNNRLHRAVKPLFESQDKVKLAVNEKTLICLDRFNTQNLVLTVGDLGNVKYRSASLPTLPNGDCDMTLANQLIAEAAKNGGQLEFGRTVRGARQIESFGDTCRDEIVNQSTLSVDGIQLQSYDEFDLSQDAGTCQLYKDAGCL